MSPARRIPPLPRDAHVVVVGGANTDVVGMPDGVLLAHDSNPGHVRTSAGGVGRNIAENMARLGAAVHLVTAFGCDAASGELAASCRVAGVDVSSSVVSSDLPGARYLAIMDRERDLAVAVNDMRVLETLRPAAMAESGRASLLASAAMVVADCNLPAETLLWLAEHVSVPLVVDPVSAPKAPRVAVLLPRLAAVKASCLEAGALLGREVGGLDAAREAAEDLVAAGVGVAFVTCGPAGTAWAAAGRSGALPAPGVAVAITNGAGDAFCAGAAYALLAGADAEAAAFLGTAVSALTLTDEETVSPRVSLAAALAWMEENE